MIRDRGMMPRTSVSGESSGEGVAAAGGFWFSGASAPGWAGTGGGGGVCPPPAPGAWPPAGPPVPGPCRPSAT